MNTSPQPHRAEACLKVPTAKLRMTPRVRAPDAIGRRMCGSVFGVIDTGLVRGRFEFAYGSARVEGGGKTNG